MSMSKAEELKAAVIADLPKDPRSIVTCCTLEALTYDGRAGKQREKNGARLTDGPQDTARPMDVPVVRRVWVVDSFNAHRRTADQRPHQTRRASLPVGWAEQG